MYSSLSKKYKVLAGVLAVVALAVLMQAEARGQVVTVTPLPAPPPLRLVPREERSKLDAENDPKSRVRLSLELAEARLTRAEQMTTAQQFESASRELGIYQGILADALRFLKQQKEQKKLRDIYRRFEMSLRSHAPRLETMRRATPLEYAVNIKTVTEYTKTVRGEALNGFYGDTVIRDTQGDEEKTPEEGKTAPAQNSPKDQP